MDFVNKLCNGRPINKKSYCVIPSADLSIYHNCMHDSVFGDVFVLRFYGPVNPKGSCRARSVYLTTRLLGKLSPLSG